MQIFTKDDTTEYIATLLRDIGPTYKTLYVGKIATVNAKIDKYENTVNDLQNAYRADGGVGDFVLMLHAVSGYSADYDIIVPGPSNFDKSSGVTGFNPPVPVTCYKITGLTTFQNNKLTAKGYNANKLPDTYTSGYVYVGKAS